MRVSYQWLQEYVDLKDISPQELGDRLTLAGLEVGTVDEPGKDIKKVVTGKIEEITAHPNADKLVVCQIRVGQDEVLQIVTGAPNVREGHIVPVAVAGARLAGGFKIKKTKLRGVESRGMLCSGAELGLDPQTMPQDQAEGVMILAPDTPIGADIKEVLGLDDVILELDLTPNRGDCMSMLGVAREVAAIFGRSVQRPQWKLDTVSPQPEDTVQVDIQVPDLCGRYVARLLKNIKIGPSPAWMQKRLQAVNIRPINNVVDVTNYVMMETGQPLHAFDYHKIVNHHIIVRLARNKELIDTLDQEQRQLTENMLVITDPQGPVAVAGVMGGLHSQVTDATTAVLLESAYFQPISVRRTSRVLGLRSESSSRFEKGVNIEGCGYAADRAAYLLASMGAAQVVDVLVDNYPTPMAEKTITLRQDKVNDVLDLTLSTEEIKALLLRLQFKVTLDPDDTGVLLVTAPGYRPDVQIEVDLIEEVARMYGVNKVPNTLPTGVITRGARNYEQSLALKIKSFFVQHGFSETVTYSFVSPGVFNKLSLPEDSHYRQVVSIANPLSEEQSVMRTLLYPGLLEVLQRNSNHQIYNGAVFEIGRLFYPQNSGAVLPHEVPALAAAATGVINAGWNAKAQPMDFYFLKGILSTLLDHLGAGRVTYTANPDLPGFHPGRTATVFVQGQQLGTIGELHPDVQENYDLSQPVVVLELDFNVLAAVSGQPPKHNPLPKFPGVERDLAVVLDQDVPVGEIKQRIYQSADKAVLRQVQVFDVYIGQQVESGKRSIAFKLNFQAHDRTLVDEEVNQQMQQIMNNLQQDLGAVLRQ